MTPNPQFSITGCRSISKTLTRPQHQTISLRTAIRLTARFMQALFGIWTTRGIITEASRVGATAAQTDRPGMLKTAQFTAGFLRIQQQAIPRAQEHQICAVPSTARLQTTALISGAWLKNTGSQESGLLLKYFSVMQPMKAASLSPLPNTRLPLKSRAR